MKKEISIDEVLKSMDAVDESGRPLSFDLEVRTFSRQNKTGGNMRFYNGVRKPVAKVFQKAKTDIEKLFSQEKERKNPYHFANRTRNIELADGSIKKVNYLFIIKFNGKKVVY